MFKYIWRMTECLLCVRSSICIILFNPHNSYYPHQKDEKMKIFREISKLPKKCELNSSRLTQEPTLLTTNLSLKGVSEIVDAFYLSINKNFHLSHWWGVSSSSNKLHHIIKKDYYCLQSVGQVEPVVLTHTQYHV